MTLNMDYNLSDGTWVRKALPENLRLEGEDDMAFAMRMGPAFFPEEDGFTPKDWSVAEKLHEVTPDPAPAPVRDLAAEIDALNAKLTQMQLAQATASKVSP